MVLTVLISNDRVSFALFEGGIEPAEAYVEESVQLAACPVRTADEYEALLSMMLLPKAGEREIETCILASAVPALTDPVSEAVQRLFPNAVALTVGAGLKNGFSIRTDAPAELGADLVALISGALPQQEPPFRVLDCSSTVTTVSAVAAGKNGPEFLGCAILPGPDLGADALKTYAAQLPHVRVTKPSCAVGTNTGDSMRAGLMLGYVGAVKHLADLFEKEMNGEEVPAIVTGDHHAMFMWELDRVCILHPELAHVGLYRLALLNARKGKNPPKRA